MIPRVTSNENRTLLHTVQRDGHTLGGFMAVKYLKVYGAFATRKPSHLQLFVAASAGTPKRSFSFLIGSPKYMLRFTLKGMRTMNSGFRQRIQNSQSSCD